MNPFPKDGKRGSLDLQDKHTISTFTPRRVNGISLLRRPLQRTTRKSDALTCSSNIEIVGKIVKQWKYCAFFWQFSNMLRRPSSWREDKIERSIEEARTTLEGYRKSIEDKTATLEELAGKYSDCSSAKRGGDLGFFTRGAMQKPFEDAAFELEVGQLSDIVETDSGVHIILRTA